MTTAEVLASTNLEMDSSITILHADKRSATVALNTEGYNVKMEEHISTGPYNKNGEPKDSYEQSNQSWTNVPRFTFILRRISVQGCMDN